MSEAAKAPIRSLFGDEYDSQPSPLALESDFKLEFAPSPRSGCIVMMVFGTATGNCSKAEMETYVLQGFNAVLPKPFDLNALASCLAVHCATLARR